MNQNWNQDPNLTRTLDMLNQVLHAVENKKQFDSAGNQVYPIAVAAGSTPMDMEHGVTGFKMNR